MNLNSFVEASGEDKGKPGTCILPQLHQITANL